MTAFPFRRIAALCLIALTALTAGACGDPEPVLIGVLVPDTGAASTYAKGIRNGATLGAEEVNAAGGVLGGRMIKLEFRDTGTRVDTAVVAARELIETEGAWALIGPVSSSVALGLVPVATETKTVVLSPAASSPQLTTDGGEYFFRNYPSDVVEGSTMAEFCRRLALARVAVVATDDLFGRGISEIFTKKYEAETRRVVMQELFPSGIGASDALELAKRIEAAKADAVYIAAYQPDVAAVLKALASIGGTTPRLATSAVTRGIVETAGEAAEGLVFSQTAFNPANKAENVQTFVNAYRAKYGDQLPDNFAAHAYDAVRVLAAAIDKAHLKQEIKNTLWNIQFKGVTGTIDFDLNGDVVQAPYHYAILNGEVVTYEEYRDAKVGQSILAPSRP